MPSLLARFALLALAASFYQPLRAADISLKGLKPGPTVSGSEIPVEALDGKVVLVEIWGMM
jgi:hypothetical protein